jgi:hypothetical protein
MAQRRVRLICPRIIHPSAWNKNSANFACPSLLCDSVSYEEVHESIDVYIRNIIPFRIRLPHRRSWPYRGWGYALNFALTAF